MDRAIKPFEDNIKLSIPSVVFIEIFDKWLIKEEYVKSFYYNAYLKLLESPNVEIKPIERDVLEILITIKDELDEHEISDKIVVSSAIELDCSLLTTDNKVIEYNKRRKRIMRIVS